MSFWMAIFLGIVQGLTEFLPVSSSGHLSIIQNLFKLDYEPEEHLFFDVLLHLGTLAAVCVFYWKDLKLMWTECLSFLTGKDSGQGESGRLKPSVRTVVMILVATLPLIVILPFHSKLGLLYGNTFFICFAMLVTGCLLFISGKLTEGRKNAKTITVVDALTVGAAQMAATVPGLSRSGATITMGLACGLRRDYAVKFSFLMSIPAILGSVLVTFISSIRAGIDWGLVPLYLIGMIVAGGVGYLCLHLLRMLVLSNLFSKFAYYCWGMGAVAFILSLILG